MPSNKTQISAPVLLVYMLSAVFFISIPFTAAAADDLWTEALKSFDAGENAAAMERLDEYLFENPDGRHVAEAHLLYGRILVFEGRCDKAEAHLKTVTRLYPDSPQAPEANDIFSECVKEASGKNPPEPAAAPAPAPARAEEEKNNADKAADKAAAEDVDVSAQLDEFEELFKSYRRASASDKAASYAALLSYIDRVRLPALNEVQEEVDKSEFPYVHILFRRALLNHHFGHDGAAYEMLGRIIIDYPDHELNARASAMYERIKKSRMLETLKIGVLYPSSGKYQVYGKLVKQALELARADFEKAQDPNKPPVQFVERDSGGEAYTAVRALEELYFDENVIAVIGPIMSEEAEACAFRAEELGLPMISLSRLEGLVDIGPNIFRLMLTNSAQAAALVDYAWNVQGRRSFLILHPQHPYGEELMKYFWEEVRMRGGEIKGVEHYEDDATQFDYQARKLVGRYRAHFTAWTADCDSNTGEGCGRVMVRWPADGDKYPIHPVLDFDAIFIPDYYRNIAMIAPALAAEDLEFDTGQKETYVRMRVRSQYEKWDIKAVQLLGSNGWDDPSLPEKVGEWVEGSIFPSSFYTGDEENKITQSFVSRYREKFNQDAGIIEANVYDAVGAARRVIESKAPQSRPAMRVALDDLDSYEGVTGNFNFSENGDVKREIVMLTVRNGKIIRAPETYMTYEEWEALDREKEKSEPKEGEAAGQTDAATPAAPAQ